MGGIYPLVVQLAWGPNGRLSNALGSDRSTDYFQGCGVTDFAGSGVVHLTGGACALVGAVIIGPRRAFIDGTLRVSSYGPAFQVAEML
jgi:Amt family ammonium transporter